jgi:hypothetical protein
MVFVFKVWYINCKICILFSSQSTHSSKHYIKIYKTSLPLISKRVLFCRGKNTSILQFCKHDLPGQTCAYLTSSTECYFIPCFRQKLLVKNKICNTSYTIYLIRTYSKIINSILHNMMLKYNLLINPDEHEHHNKSGTSAVGCKCAYANLTTLKWWLRIMLQQNHCQNQPMEIELNSIPPTSHVLFKNSVVQTTNEHA